MLHRSCRFPLGARAAVGDRFGPRLCRLAGGFILLAAAAVLIGCSQHEARPRIVVSGASTVFPLVEASREQLARDYHLDVVAQTGGSTRGFEDCINGRNDLGAMAREPTSEEARQIMLFPIAYDGVGIVVNEANPLVTITTGQLRRIYRKQECNWRAFTTWDREITVVNRAEGHATLEIFLEHTGLNRDEIKPDAVGGDNAQIIRLVANSKTAIGYVSVGEAIHAREIGIPVRLLTLDGIEPTLAHIADKTYPMFRQLYLIARGAPSAQGRVLIDFFHSKDGQQIIREAKYVPIL